MIASRWRSLLIVPCFAVCAGAQTPVAPQWPDSTQQAEMQAHLKAYASTYSRDLPEFTCAQSSFKNSDALEGHFRANSVIAVDLGPQRRREQKGLGASASVDGLIRDLFSSSNQFTFDRWAVLLGRRVAVYRYGQQSDRGDRQAEVYAEAETGVISRIVFRGFDTPAHFAGYYCWVEQN
jgi:hypothetical protein